MKITFMMCCLLFGCDSLSQPGLTQVDGRFDTPSSNAEDPDSNDALEVDSPTNDDWNLALGQWADGADLVLWLGVDFAEGYEDPLTGDIRTEVVLRVLEVMHGDGAKVSAIKDPFADGMLWLDIPGGQVGEVGVLTSQAPLLFAGDELLARMVFEDDELRFEPHRPILPVRDDAVRACINPHHDAVLRCIDQGEALLVTPELPMFNRADERSIWNLR